VPCLRALQPASVTARAVPPVAVLYSLSYYPLSLSYYPLSLGYYPLSLSYYPLSLGYCSLSLSYYSLSLGGGCCDSCACHS